jgi:hypothetical protein
LPCYCAVSIGSLQGTCHAYIMFLSYTATSILGKCLKILRIFCGSRDRKFVFQPGPYTAPLEKTILFDIWDFFRHIGLTAPLVKKSCVQSCFQQSNMDISTICSPSRTIGIRRNIYLESSILYNYFLIVSWFRIT